MDSEQIRALTEWSIKVQASIDAFKYFLGGLVVLGAGIITLLGIIGRSFKDYTAERFKSSDDRCAECTKRNTDEHKNLHSRIDEHIRDHANKNK